ncbi:hypothetical protein JCM5353_005617 [Sporobolomyces roseus]
MPKSPSKPTQEYSHWLAEPDSRIEKGVDVKFSIDDFEKCKVSSWEGVRNHQAKNFLKSQMKLDHLCLFYASNTKVPGITGIAKVVKEGYPDYNAWDPKHPYYDPKSKADNPTWYMVDVEFVSRLPHLVPLALLQHLAQLSSPPSSLPYLTSSHLTEIANSALISRGRLSVQPATEGFFEACKMLGEKGGFEGLLEEIKEGKKKGKGKGKAVVKKEEEEVSGDEEEKNGSRKPTRAKKTIKQVKEEASEEEEEEEKPKPTSSKVTKSASKSKRGRKAVKAEEEEEDSASEEEKMPSKGSSSRPQSKRQKK